MDLVPLCVKDFGLFLITPIWECYSRALNLKSNLFFSLLVFVNWFWRLLVYSCVRTSCNFQTSDLSLYINAKIVYSFLRHLVLFLHVKLVNIKIETFIIITNNNNNELAFLYLNRMHNKIKEPQNESGTKWKVENFNVWGWYTAVSLLTYFCHSVTFKKQICPIGQFDLNWLKYILNFN